MASAGSPPAARRHRPGTQWLEQARRPEARRLAVRDDLPLLNLDAYQKRQATHRRNAAAETLRVRIPETYARLLVPIQDEPNGPMAWRDITLQGAEALAARASKKLRHEELLMAELGGTRLRLELDRVPLWRGTQGDSVSIKQLAEDFAQYLYLPHLKDEQLLLNAITAGVSALTWQQETFAYAEGYDEDRGRYLGLVAGRQVFPMLDGGGLLVKPEVAAAQFVADEAVRAQSQTHLAVTDQQGSVTYSTTVVAGEPARGAESGDGRTAYDTPSPAPSSVIGPKRFYGSVRLDSQRAMRHATTVIQEVVQHLTGLFNTEVGLTLEISAEISDGAPDYVVRTVMENCRTLKFTGFGFEEEPRG